MREALEILKDESNNDKQLIKELSVYIKNHRDSNKKITKKTVMDLFSIILSNDNLDVDDVMSTYLDDSFGTYSHFYNMVYIDMTAILNYVNKEYNNVYNFLNNKQLYTYNAVLEVLIHELDHAKQYKLLTKNEIYKLSYEICEEHNDDYTNHYYCIPIERTAFIRGYYITYQVLSYIYPEEKLGIIKSRLIDALLFGYEIDDNNSVMSPMNVFNGILEKNKIEQIDINSIHADSIISRLYLGLDITVDEYNYMCDIYSDILSNNIDSKYVKSLFKDK